MSRRTRRPPRTENRFREREVSRAYRAVAETGAAVDRVEIDPHTGKISVIIATPGESKDSDTPERIISKL